MVAKSKPARKLVSVLSSSSSQSPVNLTANVSTLNSSSTGQLVAMDSNKDNASGSRVWHTDTDPNSSAGILVAWSVKSTFGTR